MNLFPQIIDHPCDPLLDQHCSKIDQQAQPLIGQLEIGKQLFLVNRRNLLDRFELDNHFVFHDQVGAKAHFQLYRFVMDGDRLLTLYPYPALFQFMDKQSFLSGF